MRTDAIQIERHSDDCAAVDAVLRGDWTTPWSGIPERTEWRAADGSHRGNHHAWLVLRCNDSACPAETLVRERAVADLAHKITSGRAVLASAHPEAHTHERAATGAAAREGE